MVYKHVYKPVRKERYNPVHFVDDEKCVPYTQNRPVFIKGKNMWAELIVVCSAILIQSTLSLVLMFGGVHGVRTGIFDERNHPIDEWASRLFGALLLFALFGAEFIQPTQKMHEHGQLVFIGAVILGFFTALYIRKHP